MDVSGRMNGNHASAAGEGEDRWFSLDDRKAVLKIDEATLAALHEAGPELAQHAETIAGEFYERLMSIPALEALVNRYSTVDRLSRTLERYITDFGATVLDDAHVTNRLRIAAMHDRIGLPIDAYQSQLQAIRETWLRLLLTTDRKGRLRRSPEEVLRLYAALDKALTFDEGTVSLYFTDALKDSLAEVDERRIAHEALQAELLKLAGHLATNAEGSVERVRNATESLGLSAGELEDNSSEIGEVVGVLRRTADRIDLLALNAAVEASHAGAAGRGFAVVANEVRKLAEATQQSLAESSAAVETIQRLIHEVREAGRAAAIEVEGLVEATSQLRDRFNEMIDSAGSETPGTTPSGVTLAARAASEVAARLA